MNITEEKHNRTQKFAKKWYSFRRLILLTFLMPFYMVATAQVYILNEDFVSGTGTTPPLEWSNYAITGSAIDQWHFDNPGNRNAGFPITSPFAIFDADSVSGDGQSEKVVLESPYFDASISNHILLRYDQTLLMQSGAVAIIEGYNGQTWTEIKRFTTSTPGTTSEIVNISVAAGGITNAKIRFIWQGQSKGYWALDNVSIYAPLPVDGGLVSLDSPVSPFSSGVQPIRVTLANAGFQI